MRSQLQHVTSLVIAKAMAIHDYVQLYFSDDTILNIYNDYSCNDAQNNPIKITTLENQMVVSVRERESAIELNLLGGSKITIDLTEDAYHGPEALQLIMKNGERVVWNKEQ